MIPAPPRRLQCPHCEGVKEVINLLSGNTFGGTFWSDSKTDFPMLPEPSLVQRCPHCGKYYFLGDAKELPPEIDVNVDEEFPEPELGTGESGLYDGLI